GRQLPVVESREGRLFLLGGEFRRVGRRTHFEGRLATETEILLDGRVAPDDHWPDARRQHDDPHERDRIRLYRPACHRAFQTPPDRREVIAHAHLVFAFEFRILVVLAHDSSRPASPSADFAPPSAAYRSSRRSSNHCQTRVNWPVSFRSQTSA